MPLLLPGMDCSSPPCQCSVAAPAEHSWELSIPLLQALCSLLSAAEAPLCTISSALGTKGCSQVHLLIKANKKTNQWRCRYLQRLMHGFWLTWFLLRPFPDLDLAFYNCTVKWLTCMHIQFSNITFYFSPLCLCPPLCISTSTLNGINNISRNMHKNIQTINMQNKQ